MNITITIDAPELVGAINNLAGALGNVGNPLLVTTSEESTKKVDKPKQETPKVEEPKKTETPKAEEPKKGATPDPEPEKEKIVQAISLEVVRGKLSEFSSGGKKNQEAVKEALSSFGVKKLTDVEPSDYAELLEKVGLSV